MRMITNLKVFDPCEAYPWGERQRKTRQCQIVGCSRQDGQVSLGNLAVVRFDVVFDKCLEICNFTPESG